MAERALATAFVNIVPGTKAMEEYLKGDLSKGASAAGDGAGANFSKGFGSAFKKLAGGLIAGVLVGQVADFVGSAVKSANALYIEFEGVGSVFGKSADQVRAFAKTAAQTAGISEAAALQAAKGFGGFATNAGLAGDEAAKFSIDLTRAAGDMASFYGGGTEASLSALKSAMMGQYEPMLKYNQQLTEAKVRQEAMRLGLVKTTKEALDPNSKALAVQSLLISGLGVATGDFVTYADSFDNAQQTMTANFENMKASIGSSLLPVLGQLVAAINPLIEAAGPLLFNVFQKLIPLFELVSNSIQKILPALDPVIEILGILIDSVVEIVAAVLPPLIEIFNAIIPVLLPVVKILGKLITSLLKPLGVILTSIVVPILKVLAAVFEAVVVPILELFVGVIDAVLVAFMPVIKVLGDMVKKYLPPLVNILVKYVGPIFSALVKVLLEFLAPVLQWLGLIFADFYKNYLQFFINGFKNLMKFLKPVWDFLKPVVEGLMSMLKIKPVKLSVSTSTDSATDKLFNLDGKGGNIDYSKLGGGTSVDPATAKKAAKTSKQITQTFAKIVKSVEKANAVYNKAVAEADSKWQESKAKVMAAYDKDVLDATSKRDDALAKALTDHNSKVAQIQDDFSKKLADIVQQSKDRLRKAFESVTAVDVGKTFANLAKQNVASLITDLRTGLQKARNLVAAAGQLAAAGFSQTFIEQVVSQGPDAGQAMATAILAASPENQSDLKTLFADSESISAHGMDKLANTMYEKSGLATEALNDMYKQTQVDLNNALAAENAAYLASTAEIQATFTKAMADAAASRDTALAEAQATLTESLQSATDALNASLKTAQSEFDTALKDFKGKLKGHASEIAAVRGAMADALSVASSPISTKVQAVVAPYVAPKVAAKNVDTTTLSGIMKLTRMATGGFVNGPTPALVGEAGPEVITPLKDFERMMGMDGGKSGQIVNYYAAPNQSLDSEQALFTAMKRAKVAAAW